MKLCVGAASRRVVEEAAILRVDQIVVSRRQVGETSPGYTGYDSKSLVRTVVGLSQGVTAVVRDHGGPYQNGDPGDDWTAALDADVAAGFDVLHLDVSALPEDEQVGELLRLCGRYAPDVGVEVGGERDAQRWLSALLGAAWTVCSPHAAVAALGGRIRADRQFGQLLDAGAAKYIVAAYGDVAVKAHNFDWIGGRTDYDLDGYYNVSPEFGNVEVDAWLRVLPHAAGQEILSYAYATGAWRRWFADGEGTAFERARAALRYNLEAPPVASILARHDDAPVRLAIADAIRCG